MKHLTVKVKKLLLIAALILYPANYGICEYFYSDDIKSWWLLKVDIYSIIIALLLVSYSINERKEIKFLARVFSGVVISSLVDKRIFDNRNFELNDVIMVGFTFGYAAYKFVKEKENATHE